MNRLGRWRAVLVALAAVMLAFSGLASPAVAEVSPTACGPWLKALDLPSEKIPSGGEAQGVLKVNCPSPVPLVVSLTSADTSWVSVPETVVVPAGATEAAFPIRTHQPDYIDRYLPVALTAKLRGQTLTQPVTLQPGLRSVDFGGRSTFFSGDMIYMSVGIKGTAPEGGTVVSLESDNPALKLPASITIPSGALGMGVPRVTSTRIPEDADVTVTAKLAGQTLSTTIKLLAWNYDPGDWSFTGPAETYGGSYYNMTLDLPNPVPHGGITVTFSSDNPKLRYPPSPRQYPEGYTGASRVEVSMPSNIDGDVTITANIEGVGTRSHTVRVHPGLVGFDTELMTITGGEPFVGTVSLGTATSVPITIQLESSDPVVQLPAEVTIPAGQSSATVQGTTSVVSDFAYSTLTARLPDGNFWETTLFLDPPS